MKKSDIKIGEKHRPKEASYATLLRECAAIADEREAQYGDCKENFEEIAAVLDAMFALPLSPVQVVKVMIAVKVAREKHKQKKDNRADLINYVAILNRLLEEEATTHPAQ